MDWHKRYLQQAEWTRDLRAYLLRQAGLAGARRVLEVGCGTGVILQDMAARVSSSRPPIPQIHGLDISSEALSQSKHNAPAACLTRGDALALPFLNGVFDIVCCHFLLLWVLDPPSAVREMRRVTRRGGYVLALAEPDYSGRVDKPATLAPLGHLQRQSLERQGAHTGIGSALNALFHEAGLGILESGQIEAWSPSPQTDEAFRGEWEVLEQDLKGVLSGAELHRLKELDAAATQRGERTLHVPTYFALAQV
ncbi:MAG TPA: class I SAM-dependent methyltransferase [Anaerolineales bacterium]